MVPPMTPSQPMIFGGAGTGSTLGGTAGASWGAGAPATAPASKATAAIFTISRAGRAALVLRLRLAMGVCVCSRLPWLAGAWRCEEPADARSWVPRRNGLGSGTRTVSRVLFCLLRCSSVGTERSEYRLRVWWPGQLEQIECLRSSMMRLSPCPGEKAEDKEKERRSVLV